MTVMKRLKALDKKRRLPPPEQVAAMKKKGFVTVEEATALAKVPRGTLYRWIHEDNLTVERVGLRRVYVSLESLRALVGPMMESA